MRNIIQRYFHTLSWRSKHMMVAIMLAVMCLLIFSRIYSAILLRYKTNAMALSVVQVITAKRAAVTEHIILPGNIMAWHEAPIYARTSGYIKQWYVDIGDAVHKGDLLADIETPELNAQLRQAKADLNNVIAQHALANIAAARWKNLLKTDSVSKQDTDEKIYKADALAASVVAARANYERLQELVGFERVIAPFNGIISARGTDIGALINNGNTPSIKPLFRIVQSDPLRLYVNIPETYSTRIKPNMTVNLQLSEHPGRAFKATLLRTADAIDPVTRTLLAEFSVNNHDGILLPGSYATVDFSLLSSPENVLLPVNTLIFRAEGLQIATIDEHDRVVLKPISIAMDYGTEIEINDGSVTPGEKIIINPSDTIYPGQIVRVVSEGDEKSVS